MTYAYKGAGECSAGDTFHILDTVFWAMDTYITMLFLFGFVWKFHLLRYNIKMHSDVIGSEWKCVINSERHKQRKSFYVKYRGTLGNYKWTMWFFALMAIIVTTVYEAYFTVQWIMYCEWAFYMDLFNLIPIILLIVIYCLTPPFADNFYIRREMKYVFICLILSYCSWYSFYIYEAIRGYDDYSPTYDIVYAITNDVFTGGQFIAMMISTFWVNRRCERIIESNRVQMHKLNKKSLYGKTHTFVVAPKPKKVKEQMADIQQKRLAEMQIPMEVLDVEIPSLSSGKSNSSTAPSPRTEKSISGDASSLDTGNEAARSLQSILADDGLLDLFAVHLIKEWCIECLLSLIEMQQFKSYLKEQLNVEYHVQIVELSPNCPRSQLVFKEETPTLDTFKEIAYEIYKKYVEVGSEFEINISSRMREELKVQMSDYDSWMASNVTQDELSWIFDDVMDQNIKLLNQSKDRFHEYHENLKQIDVRDE